VLTHLCSHICAHTSVMILTHQLRTRRIDQQVGKNVAANTTAAIFNMVPYTMYPYDAIQIRELNPHMPSQVIHILLNQLHLTSKNRQTELDSGPGRIHPRGLEHGGSLSEHAVVGHSIPQYLSVGRLSYGLLIRSRWLDPIAFLNHETVAVHQKLVVLRTQCNWSGGRLVNLLEPLKAVFRTAACLLDMGALTRQGARQFYLIRSGLLEGNERNWG